MKKLFTFFLIALISANSSYAQTTAIDWTKEDCNGITHNCYNELDSGYVLLCEYVMNCGPCSFAANDLNEIYLDFEELYPGKVRFYAIDYDTSFTCPDLQDWANGLSCTLFLDGSDEVNYYGGMGMPTVVVLGGQDHKAYYSKLGYNDLTDNLLVRKALSEALNATGIDENGTLVTALELFPNPSSDIVTMSYTLEKSSKVIIEVYNHLGQKIKDFNPGLQLSGENQFQFNAGLLENGIYFLKLSSENSIVIKEFIILD